MKALLIALAAGVALLSGYHYLALERQTAWEKGYSTATVEGEVALTAQQLKHAEQMLAQTKAFAELQAARKRKAQATERGYLAERQQLQQRITKLEDALDEAYTDHYRTGPGEAPRPVPKCVFCLLYTSDAADE